MSDERQQDWIAYQHARRKSSDTSRAAARSVQPRANSICARIKQELRDGGPGTDEQIAARLKLKPSQVWKRLSDLKNRDEIEDSGSRAPGESGEKHIIWRIK